MSPAPYGLGSKHSYYMDLAFSNASSDAQRQIIPPPLVGTCRRPASGWRSHEGPSSAT